MITPRQSLKPESSILGGEKVIAVPVTEGGLRPRRRFLLQVLFNQPVVRQSRRKRLDCSDVQDNREMIGAIRQAAEGRERPEQFSR